jgi:hypothetical protein
MLDRLVALNGFVSIASLLQEPRDISGAYEFVEKIGVSVDAASAR